MGKPIDKKEEKSLLALLGSIAAGECSAVLIIAETLTPAGEVALTVRYGGCDENGARSLAANALWSTPKSNEKEKQE